MEMLPLQELGRRITYCLGKKEAREPMKISDMFSSVILINYTPSAITFFNRSTKPTNEGGMRWPTYVNPRTGVLKAAGDANVQHPRSQVLSVKTMEE